MELWRRTEAARYAKEPYVDVSEGFATVHWGWFKFSFILDTPDFLDRTELPKRLIDMCEAVYAFGEITTELEFYIGKGVFPQLDRSGKCI